MRKFSSAEEVKQEMKDQEAKGKSVKLILYDRYVLDVTKFKHPGPAEYITDNIGEDIQDLFDQ